MCRAGVAANPNFDSLNAQLSEVIQSLLQLDRAEDHVKNPDFHTDNKLFSIGKRK